MSCLGPLGPPPPVVMGEDMRERIENDKALSRDQAIKRLVEKNEQLDMELLDIKGGLGDDTTTN